MLLDYDMPSLVTCAPISGICNKNVHLRIDNVICFFFKFIFYLLSDLFTYLFLHLTYYLLFKAGISSHALGK